MEKIFTNFSAKIQESPGGNAKKTTQIQAKFEKPKKKHLRPPPLHRPQEHDPSVRREALWRISNVFQISRYEQAENFLRLGGGAPPLGGPVSGGQFRAKKRCSALKSRAKQGPTQPNPSPPQKWKLKKLEWKNSCFDLVGHAACCDGPMIMPFRKKNRKNWAEYNNFFRQNPPLRTKPVQF